MDCCAFEDGQSLEGIEERSVDEKPSESDNEFIDNGPIDMEVEYEDEEADWQDERFIASLIPEEHALKKEEGKKDKRLAGDPPLSIAQQLDCTVREKIRGCQKPIERVQMMCAPLSRWDSIPEDIRRRFARERMHSFISN